MLGKLKPQNQKDLFKPSLKEFIDLKHELVVLAGQIDWQNIENQFSGYYSHTGMPSKPVRLMVGLMILKQLYNLGDETVIQSWLQNPYFQFFCGEAFFQWNQPFDPSDLVHFRKRIGKEGAENIFKLSLSGHRKEIQKATTVIVDTTVQEKNITYPVDSKLYVRVMEKCRQLAGRHNLELRQSYIRVEKRLLLKLRFSHHPRRKKEAKRSLKKLRVIAGRLVRDVQRKMPADQLETYQKELARYRQIIGQKRHDTNKIYSVHEPDVWCIAKGKHHKPYEFGSKTSVSTLPKSNIVVGVMSFKGNPYDGDTIEPALKQVKQLTEKEFETAVADRGYRGRKRYGQTAIVTPGAIKPKDKKLKRRIRDLCKSRSAIEPLIGHLKSDYGMARNYLKGFKGDEINAIMAGAAMNFKAWIRKIRKSSLFWPEKLYYQLVEMILPKTNLRIILSC